MILEGGKENASLTLPVTAHFRSPIARVRAITNLDLLRRCVPDARVKDSDGRGSELQRRDLDALVLL